MWTVVFAAATIFCAANWFKRYISAAALVYYMQKKQYKLPTDEEIKECTAWVAKQMFK